MAYAFGSLASRDGSGDGLGFHNPTDAEMEAYVQASGFYDLDTAIAWQWGDPLPQRLVDGVTGFGDGVWNAVTMPARLFSDNPASLGDIRGIMGIDGAVSYDSGIYRGSYVGGNLVGGTATGGAVWTRAYGARSLSGSRIGHRQFTPNRKNGTWNTGKHRFGWSGSVGSNRYDLMYRVGPGPHTRSIPITRVYRAPGS